ncbi:acetoin utilization protein AcuC [Candidatus Thiosymbion oneisti]|uniref:acetoin utilization protein AcuC n=1 Tax=Candidatus Thiosymbion oneisti TaxID=589554 RepID=UPI000ADCA925|nr:acetoin utilization protein AcuC [Candidatus Thiosymbion oneisti]
MTIHTTAERRTGVYGGEQLARYGFGDGHPFGPDRHDAFWDALAESGLKAKIRSLPPVQARDEEVLRFHTGPYLEQVRQQSATGQGYLDYGDTPAVVGIYESALFVVGSTLDAVARILAGDLTRAMVPIAGLHHARRDGAAGFCVFNDCGVAIETLRQVHGIQRIAYVDIDAHHGDGVFYAFDDDPELAVVDFHEDGHYLYPGTGHADETGTGAARGTKLNVPLPPFAEDGQFLRLWSRAERFIENYRPQFILLQCGADALAGDPITHLQLSPAVHRQVTASLCRIADEICEGRLLAMGGGGYERDHTARAWTQVVAAMVETTERGIEP